MKNNPKKQAIFNENKSKNKQPASLQKTRNSTKKQAQIHGKTARLATLILLQEPAPPTMFVKNNSHVKSDSDRATITVEPNDDETQPNRDYVEGSSGKEVKWVRRALERSKLRLFQ